MINSAQTDLRALLPRERSRGSQNITVQYWLVRKLTGSNTSCGRWWRLARYQGSTSRERARSLPRCSGLGQHLARRDTSPPNQAVDHKSEVVWSTADAGSRCLAHTHRTQKNTPARSLMPGFSSVLSSCRFQTESFSSRLVPHCSLPLGPPALPPKPGACAAPTCAGKKARGATTAPTKRAKFKWVQEAQGTQTTGIFHKLLRERFNEYVKEIFYEIFQYPSRNLAYTSRIEHSLSLWKIFQWKMSDQYFRKSVKCVYYY